MAFVINGKGDTYRPVDTKKYNSNYDEIKWKPKKETPKENNPPLDKQSPK